MPVSIGGSGPITGVTSINTTVTDTELGYLDGVTSAVQTQLNGKLTTPGAWTSWTPQVTINNWSNGNATTDGRYTVIGKTVHFWGQIILGSTSGMGTSNPILTAPLPISGLANFQIVIMDVSAYNAYNLGWQVNDEFTGTANDGSGLIRLVSNMTSTYPFTRVAGDWIRYAGTYETSA